MYFYEYDNISIPCKQFTTLHDPHSNITCRYATAGAAGATVVAVAAVVIVAAVAAAAATGAGALVLLQVRLHLRPSELNK